MKTMLYRVLCPLAAAVAVGACGSDLTLPDDSGAGLGLAKVAGDGQTGPVGQPLPDPLVVRVDAPGDQPVTGLRVAFLLPDGATGQLDPDTALTDADGEAVATWILGTTPGEHEVEARLVVEGAPPPVATFQASAVPGGPDTLRALSPLFQPGRRGQTLPDPLMVAVVDRFGNPVGEVEVAWSVTAGEGELSAGTTRTAADGTASVIWTLGDRSGVQKATATVPGVTGSPVTFSATVLF